VQLEQLLKPWVNITTDIAVNDICNDSRLVKEGNLFIAYPGNVCDGRLYINSAVAAGANALLYEPAHWPIDSLPNDIPCIAIEDLASQMAAVAQRFYHNPSSSITVTGVTGTNGKTTIAYQLAQAHSLLKQKTTYIGTIGQGEVTNLLPVDNTTPDALCLQKLLRSYIDKGAKHVCMEVSSHALAQHRVDCIEFKQAIFTNLTLDHLDYHQSMEAYANAKALLFANQYLEWAILNQDDEYSGFIAKHLNASVNKITYGLSRNADVCVNMWQVDLHGTLMEVSSPWGTHKIIINALGKFNIYNSLAIFSSLMVSGYPVSDVISVMKKIKAAPGRMEIVAQSPYVLVDYAHTPDALENVLSTLNQLKKGKLWVVFGCGGDRDKSKRPIMGKAAYAYADKIIVTSDNPRTENPAQIITDILAGLPELAAVKSMVDREEAITYALEHAHKNDIILIAGKGHESYQQIGTKKHYFSDQELVKKILRISMPV